MLLCMPASLSKLTHSLWAQAMLPKCDSFSQALDLLLGGHLIALCTADRPVCIPGTA